MTTHKPSDPARAVEALDRIHRHAADSALLKIDHQIAIYEIVQVLDAWVSGDDWYETLRSKAARVAGEQHGWPPAAQKASE